jgi:hypothetical protein
MDVPLSGVSLSVNGNNRGSDMGDSFKGGCRLKLPLSPARKNRLRDAMKQPAFGRRTVTSEELIAQLTERHGLKREQCELVLTGLADLISTHLQEGTHVRIDAGTQIGRAGAGRNYLFQPLKGHGTILIEKGGGLKLLPGGGRGMIRKGGVEWP